MDIREGGIGGARDFSICVGIHADCDPVIVDHDEDDGQLVPGNGPFKVVIHNCLHDLRKSSLTF